MVAQLREHQLGGYPGGHVSDHQAVVCCSIGNVTGHTRSPEATSWAIGSEGKTAACRAELRAE